METAQCYMAAWMAGESGGKWVHAYVWKSPFAVHLKTITALLIGYSPIPNKKLKQNYSRERAMRGQQRGEF